MSGARACPIDPDANFPSRAIVQKKVGASAGLVAHRPAGTRAKSAGEVGHQLGALPAAAARRRMHRGAGAGGKSGQYLWPQRNRPGRILPRPGADRDRERAAVQRDAGGAGAADRDGRGAEGHRQFAVGRAAGVRRDRGERQPAARRLLDHGASASSAMRSIWSAFTPTNPTADEALQAAFPRPIADFPPFVLVRDGETAAVRRHRGGIGRAAGHPGTRRDCAAIEACCSRR